MAAAFVVQQHRASSLHWDLRLERDGVLVSWAVPKGLPMDPRANRLAVRVGDHDLAHGAHEDATPAGPAGLPTVLIWDSGTYETELWSPREVKVVLHGRRVRGRYALIATRRDDWLVHRMDGPARPGWELLPELVPPMLAVPGAMPPELTGWAVEPELDGARAVAYVEGGRLRLRAADGADVTRQHARVRGLGEALGAVPAVVDGVLTGGAYVLVDVLHLDGASTLDLPYRQRRALLEGLDLQGPAWRTVVSAAGRRPGGAGPVVVKRLASAYRPGVPSPDWLAVPG